MPNYTLVYVLWYFAVVTRLTRLVSLVEQELLTLPEHLSLPAVFSGVRVTRSLVLYVCYYSIFYCISEIETLKLRLRLCTII
jgi:hypothetical protein